MFTPVCWFMPATSSTLNCRLTSMPEWTSACQLRRTTKRRALTCPIWHYRALGPTARAGPGQGGRVVAAAEPVIVDLSQQILRRLEIVDSRAHVITAIEMLSPSNKQEGQALLAWHRKRS